MDLLTCPIKDFYIFFGRGVVEPTPQHAVLTVLLRACSVLLHGAQRSSPPSSIK